MVFSDDCVDLDSRSSIGIEQDVPVLQILSIWSQLEVFLERVAALERRDGILVDFQVGSVFFVQIVRHGVV